MIKKVIRNRNKIYPFLILLVLTSFLVSYAINSISILLLIFFFFFDSKKDILIKLKNIKNNKVVILYILFFSVQCLGLIYSSNLNYGLKKIYSLIPLVFLPGVLLSEKISSKSLSSILNFQKYWVSIIFLYFLFIHIFIDGRYLNNFVLYVINDRLGISQFYVFYIILIPLMYCWSLIEKRQKVFLNILFVLLFLFFIFLLSNKTSLLMLCVFILFKTRYYFKNKKKYYTTFLGLFLSLLFLMIAYLIPSINKKIDVLLRTTDMDMETIITKNSVTFTNNTFEHRLLINYISYNEISSHFPIGVGIGDYRDVLYYNYKKLNFKYGIKENFNNHNQYIAEFLKTGIFGGIIFILLLYKLLKAGKLSDSIYIYIITFFVIGCFFESYLERQHGVVIFAILIPFFLKNRKLS